MKSLKNDPKDLVLQMYDICGWMDISKYRRSKFERAKSRCEKMYRKGSKTRIVQRSENPLKDTRVYPYQKDKYGNVVKPDFNVETVA